MIFEYKGFTIVTGQPLDGAKRKQVEASTQGFNNNSGKKFQPYYDFDGNLVSIVVGRNTTKADAAAAQKLLDEHGCNAPYDMRLYPGAFAYDEINRVPAKGSKLKIKDVKVYGIQ